MGYTVARPGGPSRLPTASDTSTDFGATPTQMTFGGEAIPAFRIGWTASNGDSTSFAIAAYSTVDYKNQPIVVAVVQQ